MTFFDHYATSKMHLAIFHARELKFSTKTSWLPLFKTQWSIFFKLNCDLLWPLCNIKNANLSFFMLECFDFHHRPLVCSFLKHIRYHCVVPTASLSLQKPQAWTPIVDFLSFQKKSPIVVDSDCTVGFLSFS